MYKARRYLNKVSLKNLYYAYIYPYFTYCIEVWGSAAKCHVKSLSLLQKKIIRIMTFSPYLAHTVECCWCPLKNFHFIFFSYVFFLEASWYN